VLAAPPADGAVTLVQKGVKASAGGTSITPTLPAATTAGDLLVAVVEDTNSGCSTDTFTAPAGWVEAAKVCRASTNPGPIELWYKPNTAAGVTSVAFKTGSSGANSIAQLTEWRGVATSSPIDQTGTATSASTSTSLAVSTTGNVSATGELAVTGFDTAAGLSSFAPGSGWASLLSEPGSGFDSDYLIGPSSGSKASETITTNPQTNFGAVIATFKSAPCTGGSLTVKAPATVTFGLTLAGYSSSVTTKLEPVVAADETGAGSGWNLNATSTTLTAGANTLPTTATTITTGSGSAETGNCSLPTNVIGYPLTLPAATSPPPAIALFDASVGTGKGPALLKFTAKITVPGNAHAGAYKSTWTLTMASGP
jgi:hypothetical protein